MATPTPQLITALRATADRLAEGAHYTWTHMGSCNCGHLAQTVTHHTPAQLHASAMQKAGDWTEQAIDHCPTSGYPIDDVIECLLEIGLTPRDLGDLERLSNVTVRRRIGVRSLDHRRRTDTIRYMRAWAELLHEEAQSTLDEALAGGAARTPALAP